MTPAAVAEAWADRLTPQERRCIAFLRRHAGGNGTVSKTYREIAAGSVIAESQVRDALAGLIALGLLERNGTIPSPKGHWRSAYRCLPVYVETSEVRAEIGTNQD